MAQRLAKDFLSLGQRGCLSTRALFALGDWEELQTFLIKVRAACRRFWNAELTATQCTALDHEHLRMHGLASMCLPRETLHDVLLPVFKRQAFTQDASGFLSAQAFVLPVLFYKHDHERMLKDLRHFPSLIAVSACPQTLSSLGSLPTPIRISALGQANLPVWDGTHTGTPLFNV